MPEERVEKGPHAGNRKYPEMVAVKGVKGKVSRNEVGGKLGSGLRSWNDFPQEPGCL